MIRVTDIGGTPLYLNCDLIEKIEMVPDTLLSLVNGRRYMVREEATEVIRRIEVFRRQCQESGPVPRYYGQKFASSES